MGKASRIVLLVGSVCALICSAVLLGASIAPISAAGLVGVDANRFARVLLVLIALLGLACSVYWVVKSAAVAARSNAQISKSEHGRVTIDKAALVSVVRRALTHIPGVQIHSVSVDVLNRPNDAVMYATVKASPLSDDSLMRLAAQIQSVSTEALRRFTEHEVRYVTVSFVESRRHVEGQLSAPLDEAAEKSVPTPADIPVSDEKPIAGPSAVEEDATFVGVASAPQEVSPTVSGARDEDGTTYQTVVEKPQSAWASRWEKLRNRFVAKSTDGAQTTTAMSDQAAQTSVIETVTAEVPAQEQSPASEAPATPAPTTPAPETPAPAAPTTPTPEAPKTAAEEDVPVYESPEEDAHPRP